MQRFQLLTKILSTAALVQASPFQKRNVQWAPCADIDLESRLPYECGTLEVPLDYTDASSTTIDLPLVRIPAAQQPSKGSVLFNFGGPGVEARKSMVMNSDIFRENTGGIYDLVAFDPRGTGINVPFNCSDDALELLSLGKGFTQGKTPDDALSHHWSSSQVAANRCLHHDKAIGEFIGTASVARDLISVVDALEDDGMLRYYGLSYGTILGATVAVMFPERIDRMTLDAVANVNEYYNALADFEEWTGSDEVFSRMWSTCFDAGPELCPLAAMFSNATALESAIWDLIDSTINTPPTITGTNDSLTLDYKALKNYYTNALFDPTTWPQVAHTTALLLNNTTSDATLFAALHAVSNPKRALFDATVTLANIGIHCSDRRPRVSNLTQLQSTISQLRNTSRIMGDMTDALTLSCATWSFDAKERLTPSPTDRIHTRHPILLMNNRYDSHTPLRSARNVSASFQGSGVLEVDGHGHGVYQLKSTCVTETTAGYFVNGTMPREGKVCGVDVQPYQVGEVEQCEGILISKSDIPPKVSQCC